MAKPRPSDLPEDLLDSFENFDVSLARVEETVRPLLDVPTQDHREKLDVLESAKADLVVAYAVNSLFWTYLVTQGINPKDHPIRHELERIKKYMGKLKQTTEKKNAMKLDKDAAKRFVRGALWTPKVSKGIPDTLYGQHKKEKEKKRRKSTNDEESEEIPQKKKKHKKHKNVKQD